MLLVAAQLAEAAVRKPVGEVGFLAKVAPQARMRETTAPRDVYRTGRVRQALVYTVSRRSAQGKAGGIPCVLTHLGILTPRLICFEPLEATGISVNLATGTCIHHLAKRAASCLRDNCQFTLSNVEHTINVKTNHILGAELSFGAISEPAWRDDIGLRTGKGTLVVMNVRISSLAKQFTESVIRRTTIWSIEQGAINLSQGFPQDDCPEELKRAATESINSGHNQYSDTWGTERVRQAVAAKVNRFYGLDVSAHDNVTITCGATEAMQAALLAVVEPYEEVIVFEPAYENFRPQILIGGADLFPFRWWAPDSMSTSSVSMTRSVAEPPPSLSITPTIHAGKVFIADELNAIARLCERYNVVAIGDEVYEHLVYDDRIHQCILAVPGLSDRSIVVSSCSKTYHVTGWRVGYAVARAEMTEAILCCHNFLSGARRRPFRTPRWWVWN